MPIVAGTKRNALFLVAGILALTATAVEAAPAPAENPWFAEELGAMGFDIFREPVPIPDFTLPGLDGKSAKISSLRGKIVLLNFWATWCPPCRAEMPSIQRLWESQKGGAFTVMAVSVGEKESTVKAFIAKEKFGFPVYLD
ncbi:MAG: TlpA disulfide reductase family protein, partial [Spirochaetaceae bacterium]|nr:TlpA disulfide reductase family protein [Spirochaetaceae bacterium]